MIVPKIFPSDIIAAQSTRTHEGYDSKNDEGERSQFLTTLGITPDKLTSSKQVHGNKVLKAESPQRADGYDAIITNQNDLFVMVATADCTPILIYDQKNKAVAAIHAGWRGTVLKIVSETLKAMKFHYGTEGKDCLAFIGACIGKKQFEVGEEVAVQFNEDVKYFDPSKQKYFVDLKKANFNQLVDFGVLPEHIEISDCCTIEDNDKFYSYRKEKGKTGRMYSVIGLRSRQ
jgi:YfiH family protein